MWLKVLILSCATTLVLSYRTWQCIDNKCAKSTTDSLSEAVSVQECKLTCLPSNGLWPVPTGESKVGGPITNVNVKNVAFTTVGNIPEETAKVLTEAEKVFLSRFQGESEETDDTFGLVVSISIDNPGPTYFTTNIDESYKLYVSTDLSQKQVSANITGSTFFGARHGLETLAQLIVYDDIHSRYRMLLTASITDQPVFKHRGVGLDTARSYAPVPTILRIIDGLAQNKLNSFHWHLTDSHSFPYVSEAYPQMAREGAYSDKKVYTATDIANIVEYARVRGVRVTPELDAPSHVGEGWKALGENIIACFSNLPYESCGAEPPCGQFDPTQEQIYDILATIYQEYSSLFKSDLFHMGGDEVSLDCWKSTSRITQWMTANNYTLDDAGFLKLWNKFQVSALKALKSSQPNVKPLLWTSTLTADQQYVDAKEYIIQVWTKSTDNEIATLLQNNYSVVLSNYDELYFDCGNGAWIGAGQNWCSPFIGWQSVYDHNPYRIAKNLKLKLDSVKDLILGSEAMLWTEQADDKTTESRLFPRAAALAERLWSNPSTDWKDAQFRMNYHRERMVSNGINSEVLQPTWCYHNDGFC